MDEEKMSKLFGSKKMSLWVIFGRTFGYIKSEIFFFILAIIILVINVSLNMILPLVMKEFTNTVDFAKSGATFQTILYLGLGYAAITIVNQGFTYLQSMILQRSGQKIIYRLRNDVFNHVEQMSVNQLNLMPVGSLVTRVAWYTSTMSDLFTNTLISILRNILTIVGVSVMMVVISPKLFLIMMIFLVIVFVVSFFFSRYVKNVFRQERAANSDFTTFLNESLSGEKIIQLFRQEKRKEMEFDEKNETIRSLRMKAIRAFAVYRPFVSFLYYLSIAATFFFAFRFELGAGDVVAFYLLLSNFFSPIEALADSLNNLTRAHTSCERLYNLLDVKPDVLDKPDAIDVKEFKGEIEFRNVYFAYEKENWILQDVSFHILPGQTAAFVGATGAGKTTILSLIVRNYEPQKGQILIDGINVKDIKITSLRRGIGQMLQDVFLFSGTIRSNITLHDDDSYSDNDVMQVCEYVNADKFINKLDGGLNATIIERGENLSTGQRQLLSFARTVLAKPQILILDEATANIDTETESLIQDSLNKMKNIGTMLIVAHRLSTIQHADKIIVLQQGKVMEMGTHQELLKQKGMYHKLYMLQFDPKHKF
ncbi:MAG: ABC transporter ATP-binding protein/permease [Bacilli bacterium]|nr:ABC transporter ATP-binding protein/permease [Bacilli bacterium]